MVAPLRHALTVALDAEEAVSAGKAAVENAVGGITDKMVAFEREIVDGHYVCKTKLLDLSDVANTEKKVPLDWIDVAFSISISRRTLCRG